MPRNIFSSTTLLEPEWEWEELEAPGATPPPPSPVAPPVCPGLTQPVILDGFGVDSDKLSPMHEQVIGRIGACAVSRQSGAQPVTGFRIVGHTDPSGSDQHNFTLAERRAAQVSRRLRQRIGSALSARLQFQVESRGEREQISSDNARNRRVEVFIQVRAIAPQPAPPRPTPQAAVVVRKRSSALTTDEQRRYVTVMRRLIEAPGSPNVYGTLVGIHAVSAHNMHGSQGRNALGIQRFLPWHRVYLLRLEGLGKAIDPQFFIPYWDWTTERQVPRWIASFTPTVRTSDRSIVVRRNSGRIPMLRADRGTVNRVLRNRTYTEFTRALEEGPHDYVHGWVGGPMGTIPTAPADPLFWMHHAQVDRLWSQWQVSHPGVLANLTGRNAVMDPWADTAASVNSISALNYRYGP